MIQILKNYTLPIAMFIGILGYPWLSALTVITPGLIFMMLLLTFSKLDYNKLRPSGLHLFLLLIEIGGALLVYAIISPFNQIVAQAAMICVICPTATAAAVITGKLGGNVGVVASYTLFANIVVAIAAPLIFPIISGAHSEFGFWMTFSHILLKIFPLLICPFLIALLIRRFFPKINTRLIQLSGIAFYLWALALVIVISQITKSIIEEPTDSWLAFWIATSSLVVCCLQFFLGKTIGQRYNERIAGGQALGQKNTILAIWMAHAYLHPLAALGPGLYVLWQNLINAWQLWSKQRTEKITPKETRY